MDYRWFLNDPRPEYPAFRLDAVPHEFSALASRVFSLQQVEKILFVRIHPDIAKQFELTEVAEVKDTAVIVKSSKAWTHDTSRIWYKFNPQYLDLDPGYHQYRLTFTNTVTQDTCLLYFAYTIQDSDPEKPYIYMERAWLYDSDSDSESESDTDSDTESDTDSDTETDTESDTE